MTNLIAEALKKVQALPDYLQDEIAKQLIEDIEEIVTKALKNAKNGKSKVEGFGDLGAFNRCY